MMIVRGMSVVMSPQQTKVVGLEETPRKLSVQQAHNYSGRIGAMNSCSPSMTSTATSGSEGGKGKANEAAALNSKASNTSRSFHDVSLSSKASSTVRSCHDNISPLPRYPFDSSSTVQNPAKRNLPLTWTSEELQLVSKMRLGMMNTSRGKRSKKAKDAPKRPLR